MNGHPSEEANAAEPLLDDANADLRKSLIDKQHECNVLNEQYRILHSHYTQLHEHIKAVEQNPPIPKTAEAQIVKLQAALSAVVEEKTSLQSALRMKDQIVESLTYDNAQLKNIPNDSSARDVVAVHDDSILGETKLVQLESEVEKLTGHIVRLQEQNNRYQADATTLELKLQRIQQDQNDAQARLRTAYRENEEKSVLIESLNKKSEMLEIHIDQLQEHGLGTPQGTDIVDENNRLLKEMEVIQTKNVELERQVESQRDFYESYKKDLDERVSDLMTELEITRNSLNLKSHELTYCQDRITELMKDASEQDSGDKQSPDSNSMIRDRENELQSLRRYAEDLHEKYTKVCEEHQSFVAQAMELKADHDFLKRSSEMLEAQLDEEKSKMRRLVDKSENNEIIHIDIRNITDQLASEKATVSRAVSQNNELKVQLAEITDKLIKVTNENAEREEKLQSSNFEKIRLQAEIEALRSGGLSSKALNINSSRNISQIESSLSSLSLMECSEHAVTSEDYSAMSIETMTTCGRADFATCHPSIVPSSPLSFSNFTGPTLTDMNLSSMSLNPMSGIESAVSAISVISTTSATSAISAASATSAISANTPLSRTTLSTFSDGSSIEIPNTTANRSCICDAGGDVLSGISYASGSPVSSIDCTTVTTVNPINLDRRLSSDALHDFNAQVSQSTLHEEDMQVGIASLAFDESSSNSSYSSSSDSELQTLRENVRSQREQIDALQTELRRISTQNIAFHGIMEQNGEDENQNSIRVELGHAMHQIHELNLQNEELRAMIGVNNTQLVNVNTDEGDSAPPVGSDQWTVKQLGARLDRSLREQADLCEKNEKLEHILVALETETDSIGDFITLYQHQRNIINERLTERDTKISQLVAEKVEMQDKVIRLQEAVETLLKKYGHSSKPNGDVPMKKKARTYSQSIADEVTGTEEVIVDMEHDLSNRTDYEDVNIRTVVSLLQDLQSCDDSTSSLDMKMQCKDCRGQLQIL